MGSDRKQLPLDGGHRGPSAHHLTLKARSVCRAGNLTLRSMAVVSNPPPRTGHAVVSSQQANVRALLRQTRNSCCETLLTAFNLLPVQPHMEGGAGDCVGGS